MIPDRSHKTIKDFIDKQGLKFQPLRAEMLDHLISDVENRMYSGQTFEKAWEEVKSEIPINHFKEIQQQTMETIDSRFRISRIFTNLFIALIIIGSFFKFMHLPGAGYLLLSSFGALAVSLIYRSLTGVFINKTRGGSVWVLSMIFGILLLLLAFSFRVFQLPGVEQVAVIAVLVLVCSSILLTRAVIKNDSGSETLMTFLHEKYTPSILRALLILLSVGVLFSVIAAAKGSDDFVGAIILILLLYGAGINLLLFFWRSIETIKSFSSTHAIIILSALCLFLPILNFYIPFGPRMIMAAIFYMTSGYLVYVFHSQETNKTTTLLFLILNFIHFGCWALYKMELLPSNTLDLIYSVPIILLFLVPFWLFRKDKMMLSYWIIAIASFTLRYSQ